MGIGEHEKGTAGEASRSRKIIHIDMDAFYASVEQRDNPELRGKPVAVGGSRERGVVAAASYEARKFGVHSAMPSITAKRKCPDLIFVAPRFDAYKAISLQIRQIFAEYTPIIEPLSLDEAYLDVTENLQGIASATTIAEEIRARIRAETQLTASAGVSYNKFLAKLASDYRKPDGLFVITPDMGPEFVQTLPVREFHADLFTYEAARDELREIVDKVWRYCEGSGVRGRTVTLKVKFANFRQITRGRTGQTQIGTRGELEELGNELLAPLFPIARGIRLLGISLSSLVTEGAEQDRELSPFQPDSSASDLFL